MRATADLTNIGVLITRPQHQSENLRCLVVQAGGSAEVVPTIEIVEHRDLNQLKDVAARLENFDIAIFISANAVTKGLGWLDRHKIQWPAGIRVGAVGLSTASTLGKFGLIVDLVPDGKYDSEGLLSLPAMQNISGKGVIIFRGRGGREHLANTLRKRGANVEYAEVYERLRPDIRLSDRLTRSQRARINVIVTTSNEGLENLVAITDADIRKWLFNVSLIVLSQRGAERAKALGFSNTIAIAPQASDEAIMATIRRISEHRGVK